MKTILLGAACVGVAAAGVYSVTQTAQMKKLVEETSSMEKEMRLSDNERADTQKQFEEIDSKIEDIRTEYNEYLALLDDRKAKAGDLKSPRSLTMKVERQEDEIKQYQEEIAANIEAFEAEGVEITEAADFVSTMEAKAKTLEEDHEAVVVALEEAQVAYEEKNTKYQGLLEKDRKRNASLSQNSISSLITAVDGEWGFVVIKPHPRAVIDQSSGLIAVRGTQPLGRLTVDSIESGRIVANVDLKSMPPGSRIRPGDRVILAEPNRR
ncbi:hypothetical protein [Rubritalea marina]|uniref:hypothetical protein n=1 Tax=Rubritalea marina TaxID=361055 RepID=UPI000363133C|nr:hypothetical protein [Rubritalea marina]